MSYLDKTFCASPKCENECGRKMTDDEKERLKELAFRGMNASSWVSHAFFCGYPDDE